MRNPSHHDEAGGRRSGAEGNRSSLFLPQRGECRLWPLRHFRLFIKQCGYIVCSVSEDVFDGNIREVQHKHFILLKNTVLQGRDWDKFGSFVGYKNQYRKKSTVFRCNAVSEWMNTYLEGRWGFYFHVFGLLEASILNLWFDDVQM